MNIEHKICSSCSENKSFDDFNLVRKGGIERRAACIECGKVACAKRDRSEGYCTYIAYYLGELLYPGSGQAIQRPKQHTAGTTNIGKDIVKNATRVYKVYEGTKAECRAKESRLIDYYGLDNISNTYRVVTDDEVLEIRAKYVPWIYSYRMLANEYKISHATVFSIVKLLIHKDVK